MAVLHGDAGLGKTFAVEDALAAPQLPLLWVSFPSRPTPRLIAATLLEAITGRASRLDRFAIIRCLVERLTETPAIVVVDESQLLTSDCIELLRYLHDHRTTRFALVLVGGNGTWRVLSREPMLASRVYRRVRFQPLSRADVLAAIPAYHPLYAHADPDLIRLIDDLFAHGNLRNWAAFTDSALRLARDLDRSELDERLTRNVFALIVLRAHTLTYPALHRLAAHAHAAGAQLWLVVHQERPPRPVAQLLEALPHETASLQALLEHAPELAEADSDEDLPFGAGLDFPYLSAVHDVFNPVPRRRVRTTLTSGLSRRDRAAVYGAWDQAHDWTTGWLNDHPDWTYQEAADAIFALARRGDTASEIYVRIRAALGAFDRAGVETNIDAVDRVFEHCFGETRHCELNAAVARAAALADQTPDPQLAALIAVAVLARCPHYLRLASLRGLASDGAVLTGPWGGALTVPPELRRFLATWHHERQPLAGATAVPLFPGNSHGRASQPAIRRRLARLDAPASLWEDPPDTAIGDGPHADGRALLLRLSAWHLWLDHPAETADDAPA